MCKTITLGSLVLLCFFSGCARHIYYFPAAMGTLVSHEKARQQQEVGGFSRSDNLAAAGKAPALAALAEAALADHQAAPESRALAKHLTGGRNTNQQAAGALHQLGEVKKNLRGKDKKTTEEEKKNTKLGTVGFAFSLFGLGLVSLVLGGALPVYFWLGLAVLFLGTVFSGLALAEIKKAPERYKDLRTVRAGFIIGFVPLALVLIVFLAFQLLQLWGNIAGF
jgi:hypothetical protein